MSTTDEQYIFKGQPLKWDPPKINVSKYVYECMKMHGSEKIAQIDPVTKEQHSFEDLRKLTVRTALEMRRRGVKKGDFVTMCASNHLNTTIPFMATLYLGATCSPIHCIFTPNEYLRLLSKTTPRMIFCDKPYEERIKAALKELNLNSEIVVFERDFSEFLKPHPDEDSFEVVDIDDVDNEIAVLVCTSGSSGLVKAVPLTHRSYFVSISYMWKNLDVEQEILLYYSPISWAAGFKILVQAIILGMCRLVINYKPDLHLKIMSEYKVTTYFTTPGRIVEMIRHPDFHKYNLPSHVTKLLYGGSPVTREQTRLFRSVFKNAWCMNSYGSTEMCGVHAFFDLGDPKNKEKDFSVGKLINEIDAKIIDIETGQLLGKNQPGEILLKGPYMMKGYYKDPEETEKVLDKDGWLHTKDLGYFDDDEYFYCIDRIKEILKYQGHHVSPCEIENVLMECPGVLQACVVAKKHDTDCHHPAAFIVKRKDAKITEQDILDFTNDKLADIQKLRGGIRFIDKIPMTSNGKFKRMELRKILESETNNIH